MEGKPQEGEISISTGIAIGLVVGLIVGWTVSNIIAEPEIISQCASNQMCISQEEMNRLYETPGNCISPQEMDQIVVENLTQLKEVKKDLTICRASNSTMLKATARFKKESDETFYELKECEAVILSTNSELERFLAADEDVNETSEKGI